jgi:hypothetical protein
MDVTSKVLRGKFLSWYGRGIVLQSGVTGGHWGDPAVAHCHHIIGVRAGRVVRGDSILERRVWVYRIRGNGIAWTQGGRRGRVCAVTVGVEGGGSCWVVEEGVREWSPLSMVSKGEIWA